MSIGDFEGRGGGFLRATRPRGLVVLAADLDDRRVVRVDHRAHVNDESWVSLESNRRARLRDSQPTKISHN